MEVRWRSGVHPLPRDFDPLAGGPDEGAVIGRGIEVVGHAAVAVGKARERILLLDGMWAGIKAQTRLYTDKAGADLYVLQDGMRELHDGGIIPLAAVEEIGKVVGSGRVLCCAPHPRDRLLMHRITTVLVAEAVQVRRVDGEQRDVRAGAVGRPDDGEVVPLAREPR